MFDALGNIVIVPFAALLRLFYTMTGSYGWSLVLFTLAVKLVMLPFQMKGKKGMLRMTRLQPKINEIQTKYANNKEKQNEEMAKIYQEEGVNPMSGCLWSFLPLPILIALYGVIRKPLSSFMMLSPETVETITEMVKDTDYVFKSSTYQEIEVAKYVFDNYDSFSQFAEEGLLKLNYNFLGLDLAAIPWNEIGNITTGGWAVIGLVLIAVLSGAASLLQSLLTMKSSGSQANSSTKSMTYMMPLMSVYIAFIMPAALGIYWIANSVFGTIQELILNKIYGKALDKEEQEREAKKAAAKKFRQEEARKQALEQQMNPQPKKKEAKKNAPAQSKEEKHSTTENGRVGDRRYARGRSFSEEHYK